MHTCPLITILGQIPDPRHARGIRHPLVALLALACVAMLCGYRSYSAIAEWGRNYGSAFLSALGFTRVQPPCASTFCYLFQQIDLLRFEQTIQQWAESLLALLPPAPDEWETVALDGKTLRGSRKQGAPQAHLLSAVGTRLGLTLGQQGVDDKTNEIPVTQELLRHLVLEGRLFTMDALLTQRAIAQTIVEQGGDYAMVVKKNQPQLCEDIAFLFAHQMPWQATKPTAYTIERAHGRLEERHLTATAIPAAYLNWPGAKQVVRIERNTTILKQQKQRHEVVYGIVSLSMAEAPPDRLLALFRQHWRIENGSHWVRDVTFDEDRSQVRVGSTPQVMATLRNTVIGLLRAAGFTNIAAACRRFAAQPHEALHLIGIP